MYPSSRLMSIHLYAVYIGCMGSITYCAFYSTVQSTYMHACFYVLVVIIN